MSSKPTVGKAALVCGAGGFIGHHLVKRLKREGFWVRGADLKFPRFSETEADDFMIGDLRDPYLVRHVLDRRFDEIYQLAADMGGAGYIFTGEHDADLMHNSASINLNILQALTAGTTSGYLLSSARMYPEHNSSSIIPNCGSAAIGRARQRVIRMGETIQRAPLPRLWPQSWRDVRRSLPYIRAQGWSGRGKAPAAVCQVAMASNGGEVEIWGDGKQTRSFLYIDECLEGTLRLMRSDFTGPVNIGSDEMLTIDRLVDMVAGIAGKSLNKRHIDGPTGVRGRNSDNRLIRERLNWSPSTVLVDGLRPTYAWINSQVMRNARSDGEALRVSAAASKPTNIRAVS